MKKEIKVHCKCRFCGNPVDKDTIALNKKLIHRDTPADAMVCIQCMAGILDCTEEDLRSKIEDYKNEGCALFG